MPLARRPKVGRNSGRKKSLPPASAASVHPERLSTTRTAPLPGDDAIQRARNVAPLLAALVESIRVWFGQIRNGALDNIPRPAMLESARLTDYIRSGTPLPA